jgi:hypothetical protein
MTNRILLVMCAVAAVGAAGCTGFDRKSSLTEPSVAGNNSLVGSWTSATIVPTPGTCTDFKWTVTEQTAVAAKGSFSATCPGDLKFTGTAQGALTTASTIDWSATGNASAPGLTSCVITMSGTASIGTDSIIVPYAGKTCLGDVKGIETLRKH